MLITLTTAGVDGCWTESLPDDRLADVGCDEERYAGAEAVAFLQKFIQQEDNEAGDKQLYDNEQADSGADL